MSPPWRSDPCPQRAAGNGPAVGRLCRRCGAVRRAGGMSGPFQPGRSPCLSADHRGHRGDCQV